MPASQRKAFLESLTPQELTELKYRWKFWARPQQLAPEGEWQTWLVLAGRGFGKTRTGAEWVRDEIQSGRKKRIALVAPTAADVRDVMVDGESGLLACCRPDFMPEYIPSKRRIIWPNGALCITYSAEQPRRLRGPQHDGAWCDELAAWRYAETWDQLQFGLRLGKNPQSLVTTTPRPTPAIKELVKAETTVITKGSTYDNAGNLAPTFLSKIVKKYEGTRLGRQELNAEILDDNPNALWNRGQIEDTRVTEHPPLIRIVVGVDPQIADPTEAKARAKEGTDDNAETGIIVAGITGGSDPHGYILDDASLKDSPGEWGKAILAAYNKFRADRVIAEVNNGGAMVEFVITTVSRDNKKRIAYKAVHASRGKITRAEPVAALYEQSRVHHVGAFPHLEDQMCEWEPGMKSPDRLDALVWALTELFDLTDEIKQAVYTPVMAAATGWRKA